MRIECQVALRRCQGRARAVERNHFACTAGQGLQEVLGGQRTPEQVLEDFEADYAAFMGQ